MAIVAMGRFGGHELSYGSDADVMFVHEPCRGAEAQAPRRTPTPWPTSCAGCWPARHRPALEVDADLRPEGKQGPLVRTLDSYAAYYAKWSKVWEAQALLRADAGRRRRRTCARRFTELIDPLRFPERRASPRTTYARYAGSRPGSTPNGCPRRRPAHPPQARPRRAGRHRVDRPAAADAARRQRARRCGPRGPWTRSSAAVAPACSPTADAAALADAWRLASRVRNAITLVRGKPAD